MQRVLTPRTDIVIYAGDHWRIDADGTVLTAPAGMPEHAVEPDAVPLPVARALRLRAA
jgi:hypothetical protein